MPMQLRKRKRVPQTTLLSHKKKLTLKPFPKHKKKPAPERRVNFLTLIPGDVTAYIFTFLFPVDDITNAHKSAARVSRVSKAWVFLMGKAFALVSTRFPSRAVNDLPVRTRILQACHEFAGPHDVPHNWAREARLANYYSRSTWPMSFVQSLTMEETKRVLWVIDARRAARGVKIQRSEEGDNVVKVEYARVYSKAQVNSAILLANDDASNYPVGGCCKMDNFLCMSLGLIKYDPSHPWCMISPPNATLRRVYVSEVGRVLLCEPKGTMYMENFKRKNLSHVSVPLAVIIDHFILERFSFLANAAIDRLKRAVARVKPKTIQEWLDIKEFASVLSWRPVMS